MSASLTIPETHRCPRCTRPFQVVAQRPDETRSSKLLRIGWKLREPEGLVCAHCAPKPKCADDQHEFARARMTWASAQAGPQEYCTVCGLVRGIHPPPMMAKAAVA